MFEVICLEPRPASLWTTIPLPPKAGGRAAYPNWNLGQLTGRYFRDRLVLQWGEHRSSPLRRKQLDPAAQRFREPGDWVGDLSLQCVRVPQYRRSSALRLQAMDRPGAKRH